MEQMLNTLFDRMGSPQKGRPDGAHVPSSVGRSQNGAFGGLECERATGSFGDNDDDNNVADYNCLNYANNTDGDNRCNRTTVTFGKDAGDNSRAGQATVSDHTALTAQRPAATLRVRAAVNGVASPRNERDPVASASPRGAGPRNGARTSEWSSGTLPTSSAETVGVSKHGPCHAPTQETRVTRRPDHLADANAKPRPEAGRCFTTDALSRGEAAQGTAESESEAYAVGDHDPRGNVADGIGDAESHDDFDVAQESGRMKSMLTSQCSTECVVNVLVSLEHQLLATVAGVAAPAL